MMILVLNASGVTTHKVRFRGSTTKSVLEANFPDGALIWEKLKEKSNKISWLDILGSLNWYNRDNVIVPWFTR